SVMGVQAASIGVGMVVITTLGGQLGTLGFKYSYFINIIGFISMILIAILLPETGVVKITKTQKIKLNKSVFKTSFFGMIEFLFLITFTTNIAMHISESVAGGSGLTGIITGLFSASQIVIGLILGYVTKITKSYTLPVAMCCFSVGAILLIVFPGNYLMLSVAAVFCGFSQGMFIPQAMVDVSNAVSPAATAMAAAVFTCMMSVGQLISPVVINAISTGIFKEATTTNAYVVAAIGMTIFAIILFINIYVGKTKETNK
ncbi:MAG: MFS transporter, partial [Suipraeoptans sp.]